MIRKTDDEVLLFFLTDRTERDDRLKGFSLKGNDYIPKPFYPEELIARIKERFENRKHEVPQSFTIGNTLFNRNLSNVTYNTTQPLFLCGKLRYCPFWQSILVQL